MVKQILCRYLNAIGVVVVLTAAVLVSVAQTTTWKKVELSTLPGEATDVNDNGMVVGNSGFPDGSSGAFVWTKATGMVKIGSLGGPSGARSVNDSGMVVGSNSLVGNTNSHTSKSMYCNN